jgi:hypothetical protein
MKTEHTPGPWEAFGPVKFTVYGGDPKRRIAVIDYTQGQPTEQHDADARLIAAAPELLDALRDLTARCDGEEGVRADGSNIQTMRAHALLARLGAE